LRLARRDIDINIISLKVIFDNVRNYTLGVIVLKGAIHSLEQTAFVDKYIGGLTLVSISSLLIANMFQTFFICYGVLWENQRAKLDKEKNPDVLLHQIITAAVSVFVGLVLIYSLYKAIPL